MDTSYYKKYEPIFGKWHIVRELGEGGFGKVFEIERRDFGGTYKAALRAITIPQSQSEVKDILASGMDEQSVTSYFRGFVEEMIAEFVLMSKLKGHSNIVSYEDHDVIQHAEGIGWDIFIRMELLTPLLDYTRKSDLSRSDVIKLGIDICKALEVCRKNNIIHRDIKPQNIFISDLGDFKLGDFGIARTVEKTMGGLSKKGTYHYMAPEVFKSEPYGASVDIYSLGIVLYRFMNNNRLPFFPPFPSPIKFSDSDAALARRMKGETIPAPANADEALSRVILKACAYSPKDRYLSPSDMRRDLEVLLAARSIDVSSSEKTVGVFGGAAEPTDKKEPVSETTAFFAEPLPTA
ncbi:MAG: serine/threonine protein kinase, partial [Oscillospiraceae bacterium]|nr:serine/threonine protein kinase [Oscillospiraceae bacterium]